MSTFATTTWEEHLITCGYMAVAGVDEVGRGALAGPLMAGAVVLPHWDALITEARFWQTVKDSKTISFSRRAMMAEGILQRARAVGIGAVESTELDRIGVAAANRCAMERAVAALQVEPDFLLLDATTIDHALPQVGIIDGDALSLSIAAASIVAKVARDTIMIEMDTVWPGYGFVDHKGYAARKHKDALKALGPCPIHRTCYAPVRALLEVHDD
ncbi:MAG: ribonuclease HII [Thermomicrobiales bacterium]|nr:ribonuclease HII [Thermomicrobiales bacterium]MCO5219855.1 ribonuclease HII [Thermomicrobiales bacterium]MCO5224449.1 ribonuclease HII [Thermomicrobiales bacterium]MCO5228918.1 ribonuclease HII [Thermomicrobiales bacterium]